MKSRSLEEAVFWAVFYQREALRATLASHLGVSLPSITRAVHRLLRWGLLQEAGATLSVRGRRPGLLRVNPHVGLFLGLEIDRHRVASAVTDFSGAPLGFSSAPCHARSSVQSTLIACKQTAGRALELAGVPLERVVRIGVGHTGTLDWATGRCLAWDGSPQWRDVPLRDLIRNAFGGKEVTLDDRARALALAQHLSLPASSGHSSTLYVHIGSGIGAAIFLDGTLMRGATQGAGEIGHLVIDPHGPQCRCGNRGCVEAFASTEAVLERVRGKIRAGASPLLLRLCAWRPETLTLALVLAAAKQQDPVALEALHEAAAALGMGIANAVQILNPSRVVLCGRFAYLAREYLFEPVCREIRRLCLPTLSRELEIRLGHYRPDMGPCGCALLAAEHVASELLRRYADAAVGANRLPCFHSERNPLSVLEPDRRSRLA